MQTYSCSEHFFRFKSIYHYDFALFRWKLTFDATPLIRDCCVVVTWFLCLNCWLQRSMIIIDYDVIIINRRLLFYWVQCAVWLLYILGFAVIVVATTANESFMIILNTIKLPETTSGIAQTLFMISWYIFPSFGSIDAFVASIDRSQYYTHVRVWHCFLLLLMSAFWCILGSLGSFSKILLAEPMLTHVSIKNLPLPCSQTMSLFFKIVIARSINSGLLQVQKL